MANKVLVFGEVREDELRNVSLEALSAAKSFANEIVGVLVGKDVKRFSEELIQHGADRVVVAEHPNLATFTPEGYKQALLQVIEQENPDGVVLGHTSIGRDVAPRVAAKLQAGLVSDVTKIEVADGEVQFTRPIYAGKAFEKRVVREGLTLVTIRPNNFAVLEKDTAKSGEVESVAVEITDLQTIIKDVVRKTSGKVDLSEAKIVVSGGRGVKSAEGFKVIEELADVLGGAVGASRGACDAGFCDYALQIGQTGKVVTPDLYIAVGISGAIQHVAGMSNSKVIVAINKDPEAQIFNIADYGIVGDLFEVVPLLIEEFKAVTVS